MKRVQSVLFVGAMVAIIPSLAFALTSREKGKVRHAQVQVDQIEHRLSEIDRAPEYRKTEKLAECDGRIKTIREDLADLPASEPEVRDMQTKLEASIKAIEAKRIEVSNASAAKSADISQFKAAVGDGSQLKALTAIFEDLRGIAGFEGQSDERLQGWPKAKSDYEAFVAQYGALAEKVSKMPGVTEQHMAYKDAKDGFEAVERARRALLSDGPGRIDASIQEARSKSASLATAQSNFVGTQMAIERALYQADRVAATYDAMCKDLQGYKPNLRDGVKTAKSALDVDMDKYAQKIIAENVPVETTYNGPDRAQIESLARAFWQRNHPAEKILAIRFPDTWSRSAGYRWSDSGKRWEKYDSSSIPFSVYVQAKEPKWAIRQGAAAVRWHLEGDKLTISDHDRAADRLVPGRTILTSKLGSR